MNSNIYNMGLNDLIQYESGLSVLRVAGGWIYTINRLDCNQMNSVFVPYDNEFQVDDKAVQKAINKL